MRPGPRAITSLPRAIAGRGTLLVERARTVLMDLKLPVLDGVQAAREIRARTLPALA